METQAPSKASKAEKIMHVSIGHELDMLRAVAPKRSKHAQLYANLEQTRRVWARVRMHTLQKSDDGSLRLHAAVFNKSAGKTASEWGAWFRANFRDIYTKNILPYYETTGGTSWQVLKILGWTGEKLASNGKRKSNDSEMVTRRNKAKRQGTKRGKNHIRRRHRNRKR